MDLADVEWGHLRLRDAGVHVESAPEYVKFALQIVADSPEGRGLRVRGSLISVGTSPNSVLYEVIGWDETESCLLAKRVDA